MGSSGIEAYIAGLSMNMAQANLATQVSTKMLGKLLDADRQSGAELANDIANLPPPAGVGEIGGLLDIMA